MVWVINMRVTIMAFLILTGILLSSSAFAMSEWGMKEYLEEGFNGKGELKDYYQKNLGIANQELQQAPEFIRQILLNERIQGKIKMENGEIELIGVELSQKGVEKLFRGKMENPTMQIAAEESAMVEVLESDNPVETAMKAVGEGRITYSNMTVDSLTDSPKEESAFDVTAKLFLQNIAEFMSGFVSQVYSALGA